MSLHHYTGRKTDSHLSHDDLWFISHGGPDKMQRLFSCGDGF